MAQRFLLDRPGRTVYLALTLFLGCTPHTGPLVPVEAAAISTGQVSDWVKATTPEGSTIHQFKWLFRNDRSSAGGVGRVRVAGPDTLRFDARGPLGSGRMAAVVIGDRSIWAVPEDQVAQILPDFTLLWAMFGVARLPPSQAGLRGIENDGVTAWEYAMGRDTITYARTRGNPAKLSAEVHRGGKLFGRVETKLSASGQPVSARLTVPEVPAQLDIQFVATTDQAAFPPDTWLPPEP
ncbi:MAG: hypothetical protein ABI679_11885 [Gemmatimonadota bacterium]